MSNETVIRVTGDAEGYVSEMQRARKSANDFMASQDTMRQRVVTAATAVDASRKALKEQGDEALAAFNKQARSAENWLAALQKQAAQAGKTRTELMELRAAELGISDAAQPFISKIKAAEEAMNSGGKAAHGFNLETAGARRELLVLAHEASQGSWKNFGGSLLVLGERTDVLSAMFSVAGVQAGLLLAGITAIAVAAVKGAEDVKQFNAALVLTNNFAGLTTQSLREMEARVASTSGGGLGKASSVLMDLAQSGRYTSTEMEGLANIIIRTAKISGQSLEDVSKQYEKLAEDPAKWAFEHNQSMHFMDTATYQHVAALQEAGDKHRAVQEIIDATTRQIAESSTTRLGIAAKAWKSLSDNVQTVWAALKQGLSSGPTLQDRIDTLMGERKDIQKWSMASGRIAEIDKQVALLQEQQRLEQRTAEAQARTDRINQDGIEAAKRIDAMREQVLSNAQKRQKELAKLAKDRDAILAGGGTFSDADYASIVANINEKYKDKVAPKEKAYHDDEAIRFLQQLRDKDAATRAEIESTGQKLTEAEKQQAEFLQRIADLKEKKILTVDQKSLLANQDTIKAQLAQNVADERRLQLKQDVLKLEERSAQLNAQIANYQQSQREQYARQLDAIGMGSEAQKNAQAVKSIYREYEKLLAELDKATPKSQIGGEAYLAERQKIRDGLQQSLQDYQDYYAKLKEKQADWSNGATEALENYVETSRNKMAEAGNVVTSVFKGMEDALTNFVMTGKLNFKSLADTIISEIVRIQMRQATAGLAGLLGGLFGAALSPGVGAFGGAGAAAGGSGTIPVAGDLLGGGSMPAPTYGGGIFSVAGARAGGGPVDAGKTYLVGENGPELWTAPQSGSIIPNHDLGGGGTVVNVSLVEDSSKAGKVEQKQTSAGVDLVAYVTQIAKRAVAGDLASGQGDISKALGQRYGLTPRFR